MPHVTEVEALRRGLRDLAALSTLSAVWSHTDAKDIADGLADVLFRAFDPEFVFVRLIDPAGGDIHEALRGGPEMSTASALIFKAIEPLLALGPNVEPALIGNPFGTGTMTAIIVPLGHDAGGGFVAAASTRADFPNPVERASFGVGTNQAVAVLQHRRIEQSLRESEERFRLLVQSVTDYAIFMLNPEGHVISWNAGAERIKGYTADEIMGQHFSRFYPEAAVQDGWPAKELKIAKAQGFIEDEGWRLRKDGSRFWANVVITAVHDANGALRGYAKVTRDLTRRKRAEEQLQAGQERLRQLAAASLMIASTATTEAALRTATEQARRIIGAHQSVGSLTKRQHWAQAVHAVSRSEQASQWRAFDANADGADIQSLVCGTNQTLRLTQERLQAHPIARRTSGAMDGGAIIAGLLAAPLVGHDGTNLGLIQLSNKLDGSDFTAEDEAMLVQVATIASAAIENAQLLDSLLEAQRRKDEFLATLAHELRSPLGAMGNAVALLRHKRDIERDTPNALDMLERQLRHMNRLTEDLMDVSRIAEGKLQIRKERTALAVIFQNAVELCRQHIQAGNHELTVSLPSEPIWLDADAARLTQVIANLLANAAKYTDKRGRIWLVAKRQESEAVLSVRDTGIGIAAEHLPHLFETFSQATPALGRSQGGLGIGLSLVHGLVDLHGGRVEAHSAGIGMGSEFIVRLPIADHAAIAGH